MIKQITLLGITAGVMTAAASAATYNGDLLLGFTAQSGNDLIFDLGAASSLANGQTWDLSSLISGYNLSTVHWGVIGDKTGTPRSAWTTTAGLTPLSLPGNTSWASLDTPTKSIYQNFAAAGAGQSLSIDSTDDNSWNQQTISGTLTTQYHNAYEDPNVTGLVSDSFFGVLANGSAPTLLGSFALGSNGVLAFTAVPEPSTFGLLACAVFLAVFLRGQFRGGHA